MSDTQGDSRIFSDAWHRVAAVRVALRTSVRAHRQIFHGEQWVVLRDSLSNDWYRVSADAYGFLSRLTLSRTVDEVWADGMESDPDQALTQEEVVHLLGQLNLSNLLHYDRSASAASLFERYKQRRKKETLSKWMGILSLKIPLFDPDRLLNRLRGPIGILFSPWGMAAYLLLLLTAVLAVINNAENLFKQSEGILSPGNLILLYAGFLIAKVVHEFGHAATCKYFGGEVHTIGVMLLIFAPVPFVDATATWGFRNRRHRILVGFAGVMFELSVAAVAALVWAHSAPGPINALAYNIIFASSVSTALFNLNPLMRFDGYHVLVDFINVPNLYQRSRDQLRYLAERFLLALPNAQPAARSRKEVMLLPLYGLASIVYWLILMSTLVFVVAQQYLDLGVALAWFMGFTAVVVPLFKLLRFLATSPRLGLHRQRAMAISGGLVLTTLIFLAAVPMPERVRVPGMIVAANYRQLYSEAAGGVAQLVSEPGTRVKAGQVLLRMENPQLEAELQATQMQLAQVVAQELRAMSMSLADLRPLQQQRQALEETRAELMRQQQALRVIAPIDGIWSAADADVAKGRWVARGGPLGAVVDASGDWRFVAVLPQVSTFLFDGELSGAEIRLAGQEDNNIVASQAKVLPHEQGVLPSRALGMAGGGEIAVQPNDPHGVTAAEPFFRVQAQLPSTETDLPVLMHGRLGVMRLDLGRRPLLSQGERAMRQFFQRKFRV
jgi:putative peptide zinc metalloprotease protein